MATHSDHTADTVHVSIVSSNDERISRFTKMSLKSDQDTNQISASSIKAISKTKLDEIPPMIRKKTTSRGTLDLGTEVASSVMFQVGSLMID